MVVRIDDAAPELACALRAVFRVSRAARTRKQRAVASRAADRWTVMTVQAGWTSAQIAEATGVRPTTVHARIRRFRNDEATAPTLRGVQAVPAAPLSERAQLALRRQHLIGPAEVARLVGCKPASVTYWATARGVPFEWTANHRKRLYKRDEVLAAARRRPTEQHPKWERRRNAPVPPQLRVGPDAPRRDL